MENTSLGGDERHFANDVTRDDLHARLIDQRRYVCLRNFFLPFYKRVPLGLGKGEYMDKIYLH